MSVIVKERKKEEEEEEEEDKSVLFVKGAFESIKSLCFNPIKKEMIDYVNKKSFEGCYVLAFAKKTLKQREKEGKRDEIEKNLNFIGLAIFRNDVKPVRKKERKKERKK